MLGQETRGVERRVAAILQVLSDSAEPLGGRTISLRLKEQGIDLSERAVRYHLKLMDERGLTSCPEHRDGRSITLLGLEELRNALVCDKLGFVNGKIELLAYLATFDLDECTGDIPIDVTLFPSEDFGRALKAMKDVFEADICAGDLVAVASQGERLGEIIVPNGKIGFATVCNVVVSGALLKAGIPLDPRFAGILQIRHHRPLRFIDLIEYDGSTLDPSEVFIAGKMTNVAEAVREGEGKVLASFQELPMLSMSAAEAVIEKLRAANLCNPVTLGKAGESLCEIPVRPNNIGLVLSSGLNSVAAVAEAGIQVTSKAMSGVINASKLGSFWNL